MSDHNQGGAATELRGRIKWFNPEKGFGFVELSDGSGDVFLHARALEAAGQESASSKNKSFHQQDFTPRIVAHPRESARL